MKFELYAGSALCSLHASNKTAHVGVDHIDVSTVSTQVRMCTTAYYMQDLDIIAKG